MTQKQTILANNASYEKMRISLRYWLLGRRYFTALKAMEYAEKFHTGTRKDGTPEFSHQVWQALYLRTIESTLINPELCLTTCFLHDVVEDYPVRVADITNLFGSEAGHSTDCMSKIVEGIKKSSEDYFGTLAEDAAASVCKGVDRIHNHQSMVGAFTRLKQLSYMDETDEDILPMLKKARRLFPEQDAAYENIKHILMTQIELIRVFQLQPTDPVTV
jgi:(p)ppGpp synthase/HD superfamily hydrolase